MKTSISTLSNGATLILSPEADAQSSTIFFSVPHGSRHETDAQAGLAHFFEHMVFKGGRKYPTPESISQTLDQYGTEYNAFTDIQQTAFYAKIATEHLDVALDVISDYLQYPKLEPGDIEREKGVILEEYNMYWDQPEGRADMQFTQLLFGQSALGRPVIGTKEAIKSFKKEDFVNWHQQFYGASKMVISVAGGVPDNFVQQVERVLAGLPAGGVVTMDAPGQKAAGTQILMDERPGEQIKLSLGCEATAITDERYWAQRVLRTIMGSSMSSRLFMEIREKRGLCYTISMSDQALTDTGMLAIDAGLDMSRINEAVSAIWAELKKIATTPPSADELRRAKELMKGATILSLENSASVARMWANQWLFEGKLTPLEERFAKVEAVTAEQVTELAAELFKPERMVLVMVGPKQDTEALKKILV